MPRTVFSAVAATVLLLGIGCVGSTEVTTGDPPAVLSVAPANGTASVDPGAAITITFTHAMLRGMEMLVMLHEGSVAGAVVPAAASWSADRHTLTLTPSAPLKGKTTYVIHLAPTLRSADGLPLNHSACVTLGARSVSGGMMGGVMGPGMMGSGWRPESGSYGMIFTFTTA